MGKKQKTKKNHRRRKLYYWAQEHLNGDNIKLILLMFITVLLSIVGKKRMDYDWGELVDFGILVSFAIVFICETLAKWLKKWIDHKCEDAAKLTVNYDKLVERYNCDNLICYKNPGKEYITRFPVVLLHSIEKGEQIQIDDHENEFYSLPKQICAEADKIMHMYEGSISYNQINIRLTGLEVDSKSGKLLLRTARTYYFDSLKTNRACDYILQNGHSIREVYEPGPYVRDLASSKLSNHLGFNGFVITKDGKIPFVIRGKNVSIGKSTLGDSIGAALKVKYAVDARKKHNFTREGLARAVAAEIMDELGYGAMLEKEQREKCKKELENKAIGSIRAFYRDLVEAGKPQFMFVMQVEQTEEQLRRGFEYQLKKKAEKKITEKEKQVLMDGTKLVFFSIEQLTKATILPGELRIPQDGTEEKIVYNMMPSASACIVLLLEQVLLDKTHRG